MGNECFSVTLGQLIQMWRLDDQGRIRRGGTFGSSVGRRN
jgi:hypothetical protein